MNSTVVKTSRVVPVFPGESVLPPGFAGRVLRPEPPVRRMPAACTRPHPDPLTTAFLDTLAEHAGAGAA
ncbi:hypothetical protein ACIA98_14245 [Streptomyces sp. NPDC051366]|uniref:hypothetical protein n=1 Tax=Streptomyces sp. NPDC051366 TaxID=3365652 RepID=UPI0037B78745